MKKIILIVAALACSAVILPARPYRYIHNCDGTDMLGNFWNGGRPLTVADVNHYVDVLCQGGITTAMACTGSDFANYRSKYGRVIGDNLNGTLDNCGDTQILKYYENLKNLEAEGGDYIGTFLKRARHNGVEAFITYRMNDLHFNDPKIPVPVYASDFWRHHPEYYTHDEGHGWHREGALDFAYPEVRQQKYNMIAEQLDLFGSDLDGFEMDFCRFVVYFKLGEGWANRDKITDLVRRVKAKTDSVSRTVGHRIMLTVRVPDTWISCQECGLDVRSWVKEGLVDFITLAVHWKGDPATDCDSFRKDAGVGKKIPIYATVDDGSFMPREFYTHGELRGAASFALAHGADGIYLFNYFFGPYYKDGVTVRNGLVSQTICPEMLPELCKADALEGRNKTYSYYSANAEYGLSYNSPMPLHPSKGCDAQMQFQIGDKMNVHKPVQGYLFYRTTKGSALRATFNGKALQPSPEGTVAQYCKADKVGANEEVGCFSIPASLLRHGANSVVLSTESRAVTVNKLELTLSYGDVREHGYH